MTIEPVGSPPNTESSTPRVLWSGLDDNFNPVTTVTFTLSKPVSIYGFEAEPGPTDTHTLTATFYMGAQLEATLSEGVSGTAGALLFAESAAPGVSFDSVTLTSDADWAVGQLRYAPALSTATPEPASWCPSHGGGLILLLVLSRKINHAIRAHRPHLSVVRGQIRAHRPHLSVVRDQIRAHRPHLSVVRGQMQKREDS